MAILIFQHEEIGRAGRLGLTLRDHGVELDIRRTDLAKGSTAHRGVPTDLDGVDGLIILGGHQNVEDNLEYLNAEMECIRQAHAQRLPIVGVCLGAQLIAAALGGTVSKMDKPECGFTPVAQTPAGNTDTILGGVPWKTWQFQSHGYYIQTLPDGAVSLQSSEMCSVQSFRVGIRTYGFQYHFECDRGMISDYIGRSEPMFKLGGVTGDDVVQQAEQHYDGFARLADRLCVNLATYLFLTKRGVGV